jgi:hypothetical protein
MISKISTRVLPRRPRIVVAAIRGQGRVSAVKKASGSLGSRTGRITIDKGIPGDTVKPKRAERRHAAVPFGGLRISRALFSASRSVELMGRGGTPRGAASLIRGVQDS